MLLENARDVLDSARLHENLVESGFSLLRRGQATSGFGAFETMFLVQDLAAVEIMPT